MYVHHVHHFHHFIYKVQVFYVSIDLWMSLYPPHKTPRRATGAPHQALESSSCAGGLGPGWQAGGFMRVP